MLLISVIANGVYTGKGINNKCPQYGNEPGYQYP